MATSTLLIGFLSFFCFAASMVLWGDYFKKKILKKDFDLLIPILGTKNSGKTIFAASLLDEIYKGNALPKGVSGEYLSEKEERQLKGIAKSCSNYGEVLAQIDANNLLIDKLNEKDWKNIFNKFPYLSSKSYIKFSENNIWHIQDVHGEYKIVLEDNKFLLYSLYYDGNKRTTREAVTTEILRFFNQQTLSGNERENYYLNFVSSDIRLKTYFVDIHGEDFHEQNKLESKGILKSIKNSSGLILVFNSQNFFDTKGEPVAGDEFLANYRFALDQRLEIAQQQRETLPVWLVFTKGDLFPEHIQKLQSSEILENFPNLRSFEQQEYIHLFTNLVTVNKTLPHLYRNIPRTFKEFFQQMKDNFLGNKQKVKKALQKTRKLAIVLLLLSVFLYNEAMVNFRYDNISSITKKSENLDKEYQYVRKYFDSILRYASISNLVLNNYVYSKHQLLDHKWQNMILGNIKNVSLNDVLFPEPEIRKIENYLQQYETVFFDEVFVAQVENAIKIYYEWNSLEHRILAEKIYYIKEILAKKENMYTKPIIQKIRDYITDIAQRDLDKILSMDLHPNRNKQDSLTPENRDKQDSLTPENNKQDSLTPENRDKQDSLTPENNKQDSLTPEDFFIAFREWQWKYRSLGLELTGEEKNKVKWQTQLVDIQNLYFDNIKTKLWDKEKQVLFLIMLYKYLPKKEDLVVPDDVENFLQKTTESILRDESWKKESSDKNKIDLMFYYETRYKNDEDIYKELLKNNIRNYLHENDLGKHKYLKQTIKEHFDKLHTRLTEKLDDPNIGEEAKDQYRKESEKFVMMEEKKFNEMKFNEEITLSFNAVSKEYPNIYIHELFIGGKQVNEEYIYSSSIKDKDRPTTCKFIWEPFSSTEITVYNEDYGADTYLGKYMYSQVLIPENFSTNIYEDKIKVDFTIDNSKLVPDEIKGFLE